MRTRQIDRRIGRDFVPVPAGVQIGSRGAVPRLPGRVLALAGMTPCLQPLMRSHSLEMTKSMAAAARAGVGALDRQATTFVNLVFSRARKWPRVMHHESGG